jgi:Mn2+/Fe2+ NRAMP family transporter
LNPLELTLGIMTAVGGFVDISELVFAAKAGSIFGYALIWVFAFATIGIMVFGEMSGRVAAVAKQPVFSLMRHRLGLKLGLVTLAASLVSTLITCAAEIGGLGLILNYLTGAPYWLMAIVSVAAVMASMWILPFKWIERSYGLLGLLMIVFAVALVAIHPPWARLAGGFVPHVPSGLSTRELLVFSYFGVAILSAVMFPYEAYFYSSGGIEEEWGPKDLLTNRVTTTVGFALGSLLAIAVAGAAVETCMANAYSIAQFFGWEWGRHKKPWEAPRFTIAWIALFLLALLIVLTGVEVMSLVEYAVLFSIVVLPLTYLPLMLLAGDSGFMREYANKWLAKGLGWIYFVLVTAAAIAAVPLYLLTSGGQG